MKQRTKSLPVLVVVAVLALILGSFGTAVAAPVITKSKVKKIATKIVNKMAPTLSVANATNATNATNLNGLPATSYQNQAFTFVLPAGAASPTRTLNLNGVPAGTYFASYSALLSVAGGAATACFLTASSSAAATQEAWSYNANFGTFESLNGSAPLVVTAGNTPQFRCSSAGNFTVVTAAPNLSRVTLTRIDSLTAGTVSKGAGGGAKGAATP